MLVRAEISYSAVDAVRKLSRAEWEELRVNVWGLKLPEWPEGQNEAPGWYGYGSDAILDLSTDAIWLERYKIRYEVKEHKNTYKAQVKDAVGNTTNINIAISNIGLLVIDEVDWIEDACTQDLQRKLDDGWRILAVCPPNGTRRPDYILGRTKGST